MKGDVLAVGFVTDKDDAILFRVESSGSVDYLQLEIVREIWRHLLLSVRISLRYLYIRIIVCLQVEGNIFVVYNMGTNDQPIGEIGTKINDNSYHIIRFNRNGANASFQLDDFNTQTINPAGKLLMHNILR